MEEKTYTKEELETAIENSIDLTIKFIHQCQKLDINNVSMDKLKEAIKEKLIKTT
jgi:hypothetical protein